MTRRPFHREETMANNQLEKSSQRVRAPIWVVAYDLCSLFLFAIVENWHRASRDRRQE